MNEDELIPVPITVFVRRSDLERALAEHTPQIDPADLKIDVYSNGWDRAVVHMVHKPTGLAASSGKHKSQLQNKEAALAQLRQQLREREQ